MIHKMSTFSAPFLAVVLTTTWTGLADAQFFVRTSANSISRAAFGLNTFGGRTVKFRKSVTNFGRGFSSTRKVVGVQTPFGTTVSSFTRGFGPTRFGTPGLVQSSFGTRRFRSAGSRNLRRSGFRTRGVRSFGRVGTINTSLTRIR